MYFESYGQLLYQWSAAWPWDGLLLEVPQWRIEATSSDVDVEDVLERELGYDADRHQHRK